MLFPSRQENDVLNQVQVALGLAISDLALLAGGFFLIIGVLFVGISGNKRGRRWLAGLGWLTLFCAAVALGYGTLRGSGRSTANQALAGPISARA